MSMPANRAILPPPPSAGEIARWLRALPDGAFAAASAKPLAGDASARRYFRVAGAGESYILMHSPLSEKPAQFLAVRRFLEDNGARAPRIFAADEARGFFLLEDFGDRTYFAAARPGNCAPLYAAAISALVKMQTFPPPDFLPDYGEELLGGEIALYEEWYCARYLRMPLAAAAKKTFRRAAAFLIQECRAQPQVFVHRDYHSRNLMHVANGPGILDFQDAVRGPAAYDIVSLLRDAYIAWSDARQKKWLRQYREKAADAGVLPHADEETMRRDFNIAGAQRGLKVLGIFARLLLRDGKTNYAKDMPRVHAHLLAACRAVPELAALEILARRLPPCAR
ncbi:MAG: aminoglycoside phosphotransferase family protein [Gammaproteobacteria bacterium]